ncbi:hypothetical protein FA95DRAFT_1276693 [Auriscalpium vulgare]|uniref:Uncharacterized protein n=1 Tax=Auriscalpium vulgare TaxID=40419 RepID=A0ACB8RTB6_9AGAM|nr:hypothetical protein FA95DRAFT_1276693 [Auriscalpium vulgare]
MRDRHAASQVQCARRRNITATIAVIGVVDYVANGMSESELQHCIARTAVDFEAGDTRCWLGHAGTRWPGRNACLAELPPSPFGCDTECAQASTCYLTCCDPNWRRASGCRGSRSMSCMEPEIQRTVGICSSTIQCQVDPSR